MMEKVAGFISYIATDEEKEIVDSLESDTDLNDFLVKFWQRRDPTPGTDTNEFKNEHVRRFKFANTRLGGWQTDRGRVYILQGPPEEIIRDLAGNNYQGDVEIWIYNKIVSEPEMPNMFMDIEPHKVKFVFLDQMGFGVMEQIYSTEPGEKVSPLVFKRDYRLDPTLFRTQ
jgi:GWxTD domain-containing protein